jgi:hypothetical protein
MQKIHLKSHTGGKGNSPYAEILQAMVFLGDSFPTYSHEESGKNLEGSPGQHRNLCEASNYQRVG